MKKLTEAERQLLIVVGWLKSRYGLMIGIGADSRSDRKNLEEFGRSWIGKYLVDWSDAYQSLVEKGYLIEDDGTYSLTENGEAERRLIEINNPLWLYEYNNFFASAENSYAHAIFCEEVYGKDLCQHGLTDLFQLSKLHEFLNLSSTDRVLDLGCGNGHITEYLHDLTGASYVGIDISEEAIKQARKRTWAKKERLIFNVGNMNQLDLPQQSFSAVISIDTLYYVNSLEETLKQMVEVLKPKGRMGIFFTQWINNLEDQTRLLPENTDLAVLLKKRNLKFAALDLTQHETEHWRKKVDVLERLRTEFEREGNLSLYDYRHSEAARYANWDLRKRSRHLYHVHL
ncbi:MAG TPA: class I SAM-dependent methyltransferase [Pyrinomonadaceae bacterium]|nr:class I SAM-dependent methyltransferase [Pyrinomonadaceae bacterium]